MSVLAGIRYVIVLKKFRSIFVNIITDSIPVTPNWNPPYSVIIDDVKEARAENPLLHWNHQDIIVYTDGSKHKDGQTGLGYTIEFN